MSLSTVNPLSPTQDAVSSSVSPGLSSTQDAVSSSVSLSTVNPLSSTQDAVSSSVSLSTVNPLQYLAYVNLIYMKITFMPQNIIFFLRHFILKWCWTGHFCIYLFCLIFPSLYSIYMNYFAENFLFF